MVVYYYNMEQDIFEGLNAPQREAVENYNGATLIIAGAGSGKTRTLTARIANMIASGVKPWEVLALTFTNKAAAEMKQRISSAVEAQHLRGLWMGTFHGVFRRFLTEEAERLGFPRDFTIYDKSDSVNVIKLIIRELELPEETYKPRLVGSRISLAKNSLLLPDVYATKNHILEEDREMRCPQIFQIYARYMQRCKANGAMDFDDILLYMNILLRDFPDLAEKYSQKFKYILVDEYQDTNFAQYLILKRMAMGHGNICVVGDDSQSIYSFRGARIENILKFQQDYPKTRLIKLEQNYRSTSNIVNAANSLIEHNTQKLPKKLFSAGENGQKIRVFCNDSDKEEASRVASDVARIIRSEQATPAHFAIMYRTNAQSRVLEEALRQRSIAYQIYGGQSFYQRTEVKDMLAYMRLAVNPRDDEALRRIINFPARGIGDTSVSRIADAAREQECSMFEIIQRVAPADMGVRGVAVKALQGFVEIFSTIGQRSQELDAYEFAMEVATRSGVLQHFKMSKQIEDIARSENIEELLNSIKDFVTEDQKMQENEGEEPHTTTIANWLSEVALISDMDKDTDDNAPRLTMLTVHSSKGLEFRYAYIVGLEENLFPSLREGKQEELEEERRLFYVALTRGEKQVTLSHAQTRFRWGNFVGCEPSRFIEEIDSQYLEQDDIEERSSETSAPTGNNAWRSRFGSKNFQRKTEPAPVTAPPVGAKQIARPAGQTIANSGNIVVGSVVEHARFGRGTVLSMEQSAGDVRITVAFNGAGEKTLLQKFAKLTVVG